MPGFHHSVAVLPFRLRNGLYCVGWGVKLYSIQSAFGGQPISVLVTSSLYVYGKTFPAIPFSRATATAAIRNGRTATAERQRNAGMETIGRH